MSIALSNRCMRIVDYFKTVIEKKHSFTTEQVQKYVVKNGDTLTKISKQFYGDSTAWNIIYKANDDKIRNPQFIYPGQEIIIP